MLTIKHIDTDGTERLMEAETVDVVPKGDSFQDGIFLDLKRPDPVSPSDMTATEIQRMGDCTFKHVIPYALQRCGNDVSPIVYVMNRFGATVARYPL